MDGELPTLAAHNLDPNKIGAIGYRAPELFYGVEPTDTKSDMWSMGCVVMYLGDVSWPPLPVQDKKLASTYLLWLRSRLGPLPNNVEETFKRGSKWSERQMITVPLDLAKDPWPRSKNLGHAGDDLIRKLVQWDGAKRPDANGVAMHNFCIPCQFEPAGWFLKGPWHKSGEHVPRTLEGVGDLSQLTPATAE